MRKRPSASVTAPRPVWPSTLTCALASGRCEPSVDDGAADRAALRVRRGAVQGRARARDRGERPREPAARRRGRGRNVPCRRTNGCAWHLHPPTGMGSSGHGTSGHGRQGSRHASLERVGFAERLERGPRRRGYPTAGWGSRKVACGPNTRRLAASPRLPCVPASTAPGVPCGCFVPPARPDDARQRPRRRSWRQRAGPASPDVAALLTQRLRPIMDRPEFKHACGASSSTRSTTSDRSTR